MNMARLMLSLLTGMMAETTKVLINHNLPFTCMQYFLYGSSYPDHKYKWIELKITIYNLFTPQYQQQTVYDAQTAELALYISVTFECIDSLKKWQMVAPSCVW